MPYLDGERWVDGSLHGDLPKQRLSRLHNVNHFIVSLLEDRQSLHVKRVAELP
ncbi:MAG: hypothetical protein HC794_05210 [Nitrospiraceae bacterium]|nr:hypothetical protein [Nitrospiraceae bacterium]